MPVPHEYQRATDDFYSFLIDVRDMANLGSTHQAYTMVQGVLRTFRRRLSLKDAIRFAGVLPAVLRAIFVADWDTDQPPSAFADRARMTDEVQALRPDHNYAPDSAIHDVASVLRRHVDQDAFDQVVTTLGKGAVEFWSA